jgi:4-hydroxy-3-polyprenylbenzoate decarboxylase
MPFLKPQEPQELLTQANAILGNGQLSLAKYLWITDDPTDELDIRDIEAFLCHMLRRVDWRRDLHFQTRTTIDTLDYSGSGFNQGSKVVIAAAGAAKYELPTQLPAEFSLPEGFADPKLVFPGVLALASPRFESAGSRSDVKRLSDWLEKDTRLGSFRMITLADDSGFTADSMRNWLWTTFTRSNPALDIAGARESIVDKHWGCVGPLLIDARVKPWHAPPLVEDPQTAAKVDARAARGGPLAKYL